MSHLPSFGQQAEPCDDLPTYETAVADPSPPQNDPDIHVSEQRPTFVLDQCAVYALLQPDRLLYELSNPPCGAGTTIYAIEKIRYRKSQHQGETNPRSRVDHIYDFHNDWLSTSMRDVEILGKASSKRVYPKVKMSQGVGPTHFKVKDHFKVEKPLLNRVQSGSELVWKDTDGRTVAIETMVDRDEEGIVTRLPQLKMKESLDEKDQDLLVTCWCARLWKEAQKGLAEPLTWEKGS
ncbi:hypothetical protein B0J13DRAFT_63220 [Dactylonectria estremocensis]|uniref:Uncharacterized protein n=1 Tax=Dactylonectria estremocensis TaxID=1079267 RepID=A0A9P9EM34_9HYPO|nr:hypothetical protein B0J13DRAFT_63220 [Dactylonectria estremocensis]